VRGSLRRRPRQPLRRWCRSACAASGALSPMQTNSACAPEPVTPKTGSPTSNPVAAAPTASTSPASSMPRIFRFGRRRPVKKRVMNSSADRSPQSVRVTVVAWILTRTSSSLGTGRSTSSSRRTSGGPYLSWTTALMREASLSHTSLGRKWRRRESNPRKISIAAWSFHTRARLRGPAFGNVT
jgi:hypothetical protein